MPFTQADIDALKQAIAAAGAAGTVRDSSGRSVVYLSPADALAKLNLMQRDVDAAAATAGTVPAMRRAFVGSVRSGY
ncbi:hypothetical protein M0638_25100 [Roseomonas sp. NAR14]|uniref:Uncharacterized protein n=1 Tax=Roseomonas acroporae TaxID=2937791 RepID=A0A9X2BZ41_9PROT|nr:hypothetical protein [Roseomonas acroporae]MCK8787649.1 hypothetical protein [Roseomonas acroporae]